ncbi:Hypothetical protein (plasmid) [Pseudomonas putida]|nr:Hypothetical protein [Pseudomonas putida]
MRYPGFIPQPSPHLVINSPSVKGDPEMRLDTSITYGQSACHKGGLEALLYEHRGNHSRETVALELSFLHWVEQIH